MPEAITNVLKQVTDFWKSLDKSQKNRIYITSAIVAAAVVISIILLTRPSYITIIRNADLKQVGEMTAILDENGIEHKVDSNGTSIAVNIKDNNKAQIVLAQNGYPKNGMTFEDAISKIGITTTQDDKKKIWHEQQVSDLESKVRMIEGVDDAAVSLAIPEKSIIYNENEDETEPTAYVMVKSSDKLTQKQVQGIVMLVSRSVEGLDPENVTVADGNGIILNQENTDDFSVVASSQEELRQKREKALEQKVLEYFSVGQIDSFDTIKVAANVVLDFDKEISQVKTVTNPKGMDSGAVISSEILEEKVTGGATGGVPGTDTNPGTGNVPSYQMDAAANQNYSRSEEKKNFEYDQVIRDMEKATGKMIPAESSMSITLWYGNKVKDDSKIDDEFLSRITEAASTATGIPVKNISVNKLKMAVHEEAKPPVSETVRQMVNDYGLFVLILMIFIGMLLIALPKKKQMVQPQLSVADLNAAIAGQKMMIPEAGEPIPEINLEEKSEIKKQLDKFVKQKPEAVAQLLRNWLSEDWKS